MLDSAAGLLLHYVAQAGIILASGAVGHGEVAPRVVAVQEDGDVVDLAGAVVVERRERELAVGRHVQRDVQRL